MLSAEVIYDSVFHQLCHSRAVVKDIIFFLLRCCYRSADTGLRKLSCTSTFMMDFRKHIDKLAYNIQIMHLSTFIALVLIW